MLSKQVKKTLEKNETLKGKIADSLQRSVPTINRWLRNNDSMLSSESVLLIIQSELGLSREEVLNTKSHAA